MARVLLALGVLAGIMLAPTAAVPAAASSHHEVEFVARLNDLRAQHGLASLDVHSGLVDVARRWAAAMAEDDDISHNPNLAAEAPEEWVRLGENVGVGATVEKIHRAFAASDSHRRNLLESGFTFVGVGVVTGRDGALFVTQNFMAVAETPAPAPAPAVEPARSVRPASRAAPRGPDPAPAPPAAPPPASPSRVHYVLEFLAEWDRGMVVPTRPRSANSALVS